MSLVRAVNSCLRGVGLSPIASEDEFDENLDAAFAYQNIEQCSLDIQSRGWWFNQEANWLLTPDSNGRIKVPNDILSARVYNGSWFEPIITRGDYFYSKDTHSLDLGEYVQGSGKIEFQFIKHLDYNDLPLSAQFAIQYRARRTFAQDTVGDSTLWKFHDADEKDSFVSLDKEDKRNRKTNYLRNAQASAVINRIGGPNRYSGRPYGFGRYGVS